VFTDERGNIMTLLIKRVLCAAGLLAAALATQAQVAQQETDTAAAATLASLHGRGPADHLAAANTAAATASVLHWHEEMIRTIGIDYALAGAAGSTAPVEQAGPTQTSRATAIVMLAVYDALNAVYRRYPSYSGLQPAPSDTSPSAAVARAAHDALVALWPAQQPRFDKELAAELAAIPDGRAKWNGIETGRRAAAAVLALRAGDGSQNTNRTVGVDYFPSNAPGHWRPDPVTQSTLALGVTWGQVQPFAVPSVLRFRVPAPPALTSSTYTAAFNEVKRLGGNGTTTPTERSRQQTYVGIYWSYDGSPWIGTPTCLYNSIAATIAQPRTRDPLEMARLMALLNVAMADAGIAAWNDKWYYDYWRPVTGIREADPGTGPTGLGDGNPDTHADPNWTPLGAQASNTHLPDFTPPFPAYPSGHASFAGAAFQILRRFYGTDKISFTYVSNEWNGITRDNEGWVRPRIPQTFSSLSQAETQNGVSRLYLGVHWRFNTEGTDQGNRIADYVYRHGLVQPATSDGCACH
jgi:hypothetical protein